MSMIEDLQAGKDPVVETIEEENVDQGSLEQEPVNVDSTTPEPPKPVEPDWKSEKAALEEKLNAANSQLERITEYLKAQHKQEPAPEPKPKDLAYEDDPLGYLKAKLDALEGHTSQTKAQEAQAAQVRQFLDGLRNQEASFASATPDYQQALEHIRGIELKRLKIAHKKSGLNEQQLRQILGQREIAAAAEAMQLGINPAEYFYEQAREVYGYAAKSSEPSEAPAAETSLDPEVVAKIKRQQQGAIVSTVPASGGRGKDPEDEDSDIGSLLRQVRKEAYGSGR